MRIDSYLQFDGNCAEAFRFYKELLHGTELFMMNWGDSPVAADTDITKHSEIMHAHMVVGQSHLLGTDAGSTYKIPQGFRVCYEANSIEDAEQVFAGLAEGGQIFMPIDETFWAYRFGMLTDRFGIPWMVNQAKPIEVPDNPGAGGRTMP